MTKKQKLELTWVGKENRPRLEPRILIDAPELSYAKGATGDGGSIFDNRLIQGDNLLALKALESEYAGRVKCVYIDPPFNTGAAFEHYDDGLEHSIWLSMMRDRIEIIRKLLTPEGSMFIHLDDNEVDYTRALMDELFGRQNFVNRITVEARSPSAFSVVNPGVFKSAEYILWYALDKNRFTEKAQRIRRDPDHAYNRWLENPIDDPNDWRFRPLLEVYGERARGRSVHPRSQLDQFNAFMIEHADRITRLASISDTGAGQAILDLKRKSKAQPGRVFSLLREKPLDDVHIIDGQQIVFYSKNVISLDGERSATKLLTNVWTDIAWEGIAGEGSVQFKKGKKPERLIRRILDLTTERDDLVLDSFAGSGTTGAVAHKMGRRWIMVEIGAHAETHILPRLKKVIDGADPGGVTAATGWAGGGGFTFQRLAPSLIEYDKWGREVISRAYDATMLARALCKLEGFDYAPSDTDWWMHGRSTEHDFLCVTTQTLSHEQLRDLSEQVGEGRTLLVLCAAWRGDARGLANLTVKKMPDHIRDRCEWSREDYGLPTDTLAEAAE